MAKKKPITGCQGCLLLLLVMLVAGISTIIVLNIQKGSPISHSRELVSTAPAPDTTSSVETSAIAASSFALKAGLLGPAALNPESAAPPPNAQTTTVRAETSTHTYSEATTTTRSLTPWYQDFSTLKDLFTMLVVLVGGIWSYFKFFKGRIFKSRLELKVSGKIISGEEAKLLRASMEMKNIGASVVYLDKELTQLKIFKSFRLTTPDKAGPAYWHEDDATRVRAFTDHGWVEPDETITDTVLIELPDTENVAYKLMISAGSRWPNLMERWKRWRRHKKEGSRWSSNAVAEMESGGNDGGDPLWIGTTE